MTDSSTRINNQYWIDHPDQFPNCSVSAHKVTDALLRTGLAQSSNLYIENHPQVEDGIINVVRPCQQRRELDTERRPLHGQRLIWIWREGDSRPIAFIIQDLPLHKGPWRMEFLI